ncbi:MAG: hypothetical protein WCG25_08145 [bacterium]
MSINGIAFLIAEIIYGGKHPSKDVKVIHGLYVVDMEAIFVDALFCRKSPTS